jgi:hypothetical protein
MSTMDRDKSTLMALHELRAIEQQRIAEEAAAEQARREAARQEEEQRAREARDRMEREERERMERERDHKDRQQKSARVAHLEAELGALARRVDELQQDPRLASEPLMMPAAPPAARHWTWGFAAVSWLGAFTLIAILWHVAQRPPVLPRLAPPVIVLGPPHESPQTGQMGQMGAPPPAGPKTALGGRVEGGSPAPLGPASHPAQEGMPYRGPSQHPLGNGKRPASPQTPLVRVVAQPSPDCFRSDDPLACADVDAQPLGVARRPKPKTR